MWLCAVAPSLPDILKWDKVLVNKGLVDFGEDVHAFGHFPKHSMNSIQVIQILAGGDKELRTKITEDSTCNLLHLCHTKFYTKFYKLYVISRSCKPEKVRSYFPVIT